ncbi:MAG TPA: hypothetical protein VFS23_33460 [Vicinamibacterales bacterium]|nr:hypothetical protein [Vicinamibacterales bacterium]
MDRFRRAPIVVLGLTLCTAALALAGQGKVVSAPLPPSEMEAFLLKGTILDVRDAGGGVTGSRRAKVMHGTVTHDVHIQSVDIMKPVFSAGEHTELNFKDSYRFNIAGYRLARLLGIHTVPMSVERSVNGKTAAVTWWVDDVQMDEKERLKRKTMGPNPLRTSHQIQLMRIWDELIQNRDRNQGNILWTNDWTMWLIDHTRAFRLGKDLVKPEDLTRIDRGLLARLKDLTKDSVAKAVGNSLFESERDAVIERRDRIVRLYEERVARVGEAAVIFDF